MADKIHFVLFYIFCVLTLTTVASCPSRCTCTDQRVNCYGLRLHDIPEGIPADTTHLDLQSNEIESIDTDRIKHLSSLQELLLGYNNIKKIEPGTFTELSSLEILNLDSNMLTSLPVGVFDGLRNLTSLFVTNNKLVAVEGAFRNLSQIVRMDLGGNMITELTNFTFKDMKNLLYLMMPDNKLSKISPNSFSHLQSLSYLVLKNNPIKDSNQLFRRNHRLSYIDLTGCSLKEVPTGLPWATRYLQLSSNNITRIKKTAFVGTRYLNIIVLDENQITRIEKGAFARARDLQELWLNDNLLKKIPSPFSSKVTKLHISKNRLSKLSPKDFPGNSALSTLSLNTNTIATIAPGTFGQVKYLKELYLNGNKITLLQQDMFAELSELETLSLNSNKLTNIESGAFNGLTALKKLDMAFIVDIQTNLHGNPFNDTPNLQSLDLQLSSSIAHQVLDSNDMLMSLGNITIINVMNNDLKTLNPNLQTYLNNVQVIKMAGNKWHCDKRLQWLSAWLKSHNKLFFMSRSIQCYTPPGLKALPLSLLKPFQFAPVTSTPAPSTTTTSTTTTTATTSVKKSVTSVKTTDKPKTKKKPSWKSKTTQKSKPKPTQKSKRKPKRPTTQYPPTKIMLTKTRIVTVTQRFFVFPSTTISPRKKFKKNTKKMRRPRLSTVMPTPYSKAKLSKPTQSPKSGMTSTASPYTQQMSSGLLTGHSSTATPDTNTVTKTQDSQNERQNVTATLNTKFPNTTNGVGSIDSDSNDAKTFNTSETAPEKASVTSSSSARMTTVIIATCVSAAVLLIIIGVVIFFVIRYRQNKLVYHRALQYRQDYSDVVFFVGEPIQDLVDPKQKAVRSRSDRGSTSSRPSEDITNDLDTSMKVYTWDDE